MSRMYWIARALRSFGYAGLIVFGWVAVITFLNSHAEPSPPVTDDICWSYCSPSGPETISGLLFLYLLGASFAAFWIHSSNFLDCLEFARSFGKSIPSGPFSGSPFLPAPTLAKSLFSDFQAEFPPMTAGDWRIAGIFAIFIPIPFSPALLVISQASTHQLQNYLLFRPDESQMLGPAVPVFDGLLWVWFGMLLMAGAAMLAGHVFQCFSMARLAKSPLLHSTGTDLHPQA